MGNRPLTEQELLGMIEAGLSDIEDFRCDEDDPANYGWISDSENSAGMYTLFPSVHCKGAFSLVNFIDQYR